MPNTRLLRRVKPLLGPAVILAGSVYVAWLGFGPQGTHDYGRDFAPAMNALLGAHLRGFFTLLPNDGAAGSIPLRLPGALLAKALDGSQLAIFRFGSLECVLALGAVGLWLASRLRDLGRPLLEQVAAAGLCVLAPLILDAIFYGHPEEPLGAALAVGSVLLAGRGRPAEAGLCLGLAVLDKPWGVLAALPALLAGTREDRVRLLACAAAPLIAWMLLGLILAPEAFAHQFGGTDPVAHPQDLWWPLSHRVVLKSGAHYHLAPSFLISRGRPLAVLVPLLLALPLALRSDRTLPQCLALLALMLVMRCALDASNHVYYQLPFVVAVLAYEAEAGRPPAGALLAAVGGFLAFHTLAAGSLSLQFWGYLALVVGLAAYLVGPATGRPAALRPSRARRSGMIRV